MPRKVSAEALERLRKYQFTVGDPRINRGGRPAGRSITAALRTLLAQRHPKDKHRSWAEKIALALAEKAVAGDVAAAKEITDRVEGAVRSHLEIEVENRNRGTALTLASFRNLSDEELDRQMKECDEVLRRHRKPIQ